ncbi:aspartate aminotransferase family protein [Candidatus Kapabacteria bacterium]|nr:aspartate aminotransferase family protein [Candidatus Kapabacteria bacterium]
MNKYQKLDYEYHFPLYNRYPITLERGEGSNVWDTDGNKYLDALSGIAVNSLGHNHPSIIKAIVDQAPKMMHASNFFSTPQLAELSELFCKTTNMDKVFFCNSGAEATEGAVKVARKYQYKNGKENCDIISMENSFHGRTIATIAMGKEKYQEGFHPMPNGFVKAKLNDIEDLRSKINNKTGAIIIETIQGEGGVQLADINYLKEVRSICTEHDILLILDEVQCGIGRTGFFFAYEIADIRPDIVCTAKGIAAGFPMGAVAAIEKVASAMQPGNHGTTFGGGPLASAVAIATINEITSGNFLATVKENGEYFLKKLNTEIGSNPFVKNIRGRGLMVGVELSKDSKPVVLKMLDKKVIANSTSDVVVRIVPPLIFTKNDIDKVVEVLKQSINEIYN